MEKSPLNFEMTPFFFSSWTGQIHWGCEIQGQKFTNLKLPSCQESVQKRAVLSLKEPSELVNKLKPHYHCVEAGGAGYKILCVALGLVDLYVSSKASTYKWDTCAGKFQVLFRCENIGRQDDFANF